MAAATLTMANEYLRPAKNQIGSLQRPKHSMNVKHVRARINGHTDGMYRELLAKQYNCQGQRHFEPDRRTFRCVPS